MIAAFAPHQKLVVLTCFFASWKLVRTVATADLPILSTPTWLKAEGEFALDDCFCGLPPRGSTHKKSVLLLSSLNPNVVILTANLEDGWNSLAYRWSKMLNIDAVILGFSADDVTFPARFFSWVSRGVSLRDVSVRKDERKWIFHQLGSPLEHEEVHNYTKRLVRERLTNSDLVSLGVKMGVVDLAEKHQLRRTGILYSHEGK